MRLTTASHMVSPAARSDPKAVSRPPRLSRILMLLKPLATGLRSPKAWSADPAPATGYRSKESDSGGDGSAKAGGPEAAPAGSGAGPGGSGYETRSPPAGGPGSAPRPGAAPPPGACRDRDEAGLRAGRRYRDGRPARRSPASSPARQSGPYT